MTSRCWLGVLTMLISLAVVRPAAAASPPDLWFYYATNLQVDQNVEQLEKIWRRAAAAGYSHVLLADFKFSILGELGEMTPRYLANVARVRKLASELGLQIVPAIFPIGYSNGLLWHDPNLAEGLPVKDALFVVESGQARPVADPPVALAGKPAWKDDSVIITDRAATVRNHRGNARFVYKLAIAPFRCYHVSVMIRTDSFTGQPEIKPLVGGQNLSHSSLGVQRTQDWKEHHVVFNSLDHREVTLYFGVWGDAQGTLQWKDWRIEEVGLLNVLRRPGTPCVVQGYVEGKDYEPIADSHMGNVPWNGSYELWHEPPAIKTHLPDGTRLRVSWYHPPIIYDGQVMCCLSEPRTWELLADEAKRVQSAWQSRGYMMSFDEIRVLNWDAACQQRKLDAGAILADAARRCTALLEGSDVYVWSDMFDPHHNARADYYLVRGDLARSWEGLDKRITIINWNFDQRDQSLAVFASRGHRQVIAGYYDAPVEQVRQWLSSASRIEGVTGIMYTTWQNRYDDLETFARLCRSSE